VYNLLIWQLFLLDKSAQSNNGQEHQIISSTHFRISANDM